MSELFLADDLSGALDAAAAFHHAGRRVRIVWSARGWDGAEPDEVIGFTTETRNAASPVARDTVAAVLAEARRRGARLVYKKIDSTLRGAVAAEVNAVAEAWPEARILFCPANPAVGRTVRDGQLLVRGVPVSETEFARDPASPVRESVIRRLLGEVNAARIVVADAEADDDLARAVAEMDAHRGPWVAVGSGALAKPVAARFAQRATASDRVGRPSGPDKRVLIICGSAHPGNREQAARLADLRRVPVHELRIKAPDTAVTAARRSLTESDGAALLVEPARTDSGVALAAMAGAAESLLRTTGVSRIFVTGGETAYRICTAVGISALRFQAEVEPGLSVSRGEVGGHELLMAVKPGGFGDRDTWLRAWDALQS